LHNKSNDLIFVGTFEAPLDQDPDFNKVEKELNRLRTRRQIIPSFAHVFQSNFSFLFMNIRSLPLNLPNIVSNFLFQKCSLLMFVETMTLPHDDLTIPGYQVIHRNDCPSNKRKFGWGNIVYIRNNVDCEVLESWVETYDTGHTEGVAVAYNNFVIIFGYKSPSVKTKSIIRFLREKVCKYNSSSVILVGDYNMDINPRTPVTGNQFLALMGEIGFRSLLPKEIASINSGTQIDVAFANSKMTPKAVFSSATFRA